MSELLYKNITFEEAVERAKENLTGMVETFIAAGYYIKVMKEEYEQRGYKTIWECAEAELGLKKSEASRAMSMNSKYSVNGNTPYMQEKYKQYSKSQLQEMLKMPEEQIEQVVPDMTVKEIREIRRPAVEETQDTVFLQEWIKAFVYESFYFERLKRMYASYGRIDRKLLCGSIGCKISIRLSTRDITLLIEGDFVLLIESDTGEIVGKYPSRLFDSIFMGIFLDAEQEKAEPSAEICCDIATGQVNTDSDEEVQMEIVTEIKEDPDYEELDVEFDFDELPEEWTPAIDADYREVQELSAYGLPRTEYPEDSLLITKGCGHRYDCFSCAQERDIRQEERLCVEAACGNPFGCEIMEVLNEIRAERGSACQFVNMELAYKTSGSGEPVPCCKECHEINECDFACEAAKKEALLHKGEMTKPDERQKAYLNYFAKDFISLHRDWFMEDPGSRVSDVMTSQQEIKEHFGDSCWVFNVPDGAAHINLCNDYVQIWDKHSECMGSFDWFYLSAAVQQMWNYMTCAPEDMNGDETAAETQQELPVLKNNDQRKQWLNDYEKWGLWYRDDNIDVNYYKFDFPDGSRLVVAEYPQRPVYWKGVLEDEHYYHLLEKDKQGYNRTYDERYRQQADSESYLVEFLKNLQKKGNTK